MKRIAMFIGELSAEYQNRICAAVDNECRKQGIHLTVFHNFCVFGTNVFHSYGERSVLRIPNIKKYDGFILASDTFGVEGMLEEVTALLKKEAEGPVICLRKEVEQFYNIVVDDYSAMSQMVEHFITEHGLTRICFMKGRKGFKDAVIRYQAYLDVMKKHHLKVTEQMVFNGDYWRRKGEEAVSWFWDKAEEKPEAIVCANDYMAISVQDALQRRGLKIPEDIRVSGFDDCEETRVCIPRIASVHVGREQLAKAAIEMLLRIWEGKPQEKVQMLPAQCCFRESCGCKEEKPENVQYQLFRDKEAIQNAIEQSSFMYVDFENTTSMEDLFTLASNYIQEGEMHEKIYICFCDEEENQAEKAEMAGKYTEYMELRAIIKTRSTVFCKERFRREDILPAKYLDDHETLYVNPLHDKNECIGYFVLAPGISLSMRHFYQTWVQSITNSIMKQRMYAESKLLAETLNLYNLDELTGIPNRRKLDSALRNAHTQFILEGKPYFVVSIDMDGLKYINDNFGHVVGDEALCALAEILNQGIGETGIAARTGGDEFIICYRTEDEKEVESQLQGIREAIAEYNRTGNRKYELSASIGFAKCGKGMNPIQCIQQSDEMMYREKRKKKGKARED
ncbi:MAG: GGDEF domain-containing protein [Roseburia sp.]|nr:GGDEF domain-containing protein [Roseburia sp.]